MPNRDAIERWENRRADGIASILALLVLLGLVIAFNWSSFREPIFTIALDIALVIYILFPLLILVAFLGICWSVLMSTLR
jgi:hypothetical protein